MMVEMLKKILIITIPVIIIASLGWSLRYETEFFVIKDVPVEIEYELDQEIVLKLIKPFVEPKTKALKGINIWKANLGDLRDNIISNEWIKNVTVQRKLPNKIFMKIDLQDIVLLYSDNKNRIYPITQSGKVLSVIDRTLVPEAPITRNKKILESESDRKQLIELLNEVPNIQSLNKDNIAEVDLLPVTGLTLELINEQATVHLGLKNISTKGLQVLRVTDYLKSQKQKARVIDASFSKKVLVRLRKRS